MKRGCSIATTILTSIIVLTSPNAFADSINAVLNGRSYHFDSGIDWNENNTGLGIEYQFKQKSAWRKVVMANGFRDSTNNMSYMAGAGLQRRVYETHKLGGFYVYGGLSAFVMTRDDVNNSRPFPGILPSVSIGNDKVGFNLTYLPKKAIEETTNVDVMDPTLSGILFLQFKVSLDLLLP